jgi:hypothetical protein
MPTCRLMLPLPRHSLALAPGAPTAAFAPGRRKPPSCWRSSHSCPLWARPDPGRPGPLSDESRVGSPPGIQPRSFSGRSTRRATPSSSGSAEAAQLPDAVGSLDVATCTGASLLSALGTATAQSSTAMGRDSASGSFEGAHDDPRRGYDRMRPWRLPADPPDRALIRAAVDLPGHAEPGGRSIHLGRRSPKAPALPLVRRRPTRCPRLDILDVRQPEATANSFDLDPHIAPSGWILIV